jgi:hypothetical protein
VNKASDLTTVGVRLALALFAGLISRIFLVNEQCFSLIINQRIVFLAKRTGRTLGSLDRSTVDRSQTDSSPFLFSFSNSYGRIGLHINSLFDLE